MSKNINIQMKAYLDERAKNTLYEKLRTYNLDEEMNYAVVVLKLLITNSENKNNNELSINLVPKVHYVTPFITKKLAEEYLKELSTEDKLTIFFQVEKSKIVIKDEDIESTINTFTTYNASKNTEYGEMSRISSFNLAAYNWINFSEEEKEEYAFKLGGIKGYDSIRSLFDNWEFSPEFEKSMESQL